MQRYKEQMIHPKEEVYQSKQEVQQPKGELQAAKIIQKRVRRKGGLSGVGFDVIIKYINSLRSQRATAYNTPTYKLLPSVENFHQLILGNPVLRMNWEYGILQSPQTLPNATGIEVIHLIDVACKSPPKFSNEDLIGFPINALFVEFMQNQNGRSFFSNQLVNEALKAILADYQLMILSKKSLKYMNTDPLDGWFGEQAKKKIDYSLYICDPDADYYGFLNWNQWFLRLFKPGSRPIGHGSPVGVLDDNIVINACESTPLVLPLQPQVHVKKTDHFWLKDDVYSLSDMFGAVKYNKQHLAKHFEGGTVYQAFLSALFYHRWHSPISGVIEEIYQIPGTYYLDQSQFIPYDSGSPNNSQSFLSSVAARKVVVINADNKHIGKIAIIFIGMAEVSSCITTVNIWDHVNKGDQIGHFEFGGSSHAIIFEKNAKLVFNNQLYSTTENGIEGVKQNLHSFLAEVVPPK